MVSFRSLTDTKKIGQGRASSFHIDAISLNILVGALFSDSSSCLNVIIVTFILVQENHVHSERYME